MKQLIGQDVLFFINHENFWVPIGCETGHTLSEASSFIPTTTRDNGGWETDLPIGQSYTLSVDGIVIESEARDGILPYFYLRNLKRSNQLVEWRRVFLLDKHIDTGFAHITDISDTTTVNETVTFTMSLKGFGAPTYITSEDNFYIQLLATGIPENGVLSDDDYRAMQV